MRDETRALLRSMEDWPWFEHVGEPIDEPGVVAVGSWDEALEPRRSYVWECLTLQVKNKIATAMNERDWDRFNQWNPMVDEFMEALSPILSRVVGLAERLSLPANSFSNQVQWDLLLICREAEYADIFPPLFAIPVLAPWYRAGHFPCGWDGPELDTDWDGEFPPYLLYVF